MYFWKKNNKIFGINKNILLKILCKYGFSLNSLKKKKLEDFDKKELLDFLKSNFIVEKNLKDFIKYNIKDLKTIKTYKGARHKYSLSVRGQRTKTNCKTQKRRKKK